MQHWIAYGQTAVAITGAIDVGPSRIVFQNHTALRLANLGTAQGITWMPGGHDAVAHLYRIVDPTDVFLLNGNRLCGMPTPPTYVSFAQHTDIGSGLARVVLFMTVFVGRTRPTRANYATHVCAGYDYVRP